MRVGTDDRSRGSGGVGRRSLLKATGGGALGVGLAGCLDVLGTAAADDGGPIKIGVLAPGPNRDPIGISMNFGAEIAAKHIKEGIEGEEGADGREVEVVVADTKSSALQARRQYHRLLLQEHVDATVGVYNTPALDNIIEDIARQRTVHITSGSTSMLPTELMREDYERYKYHFHATTNGSQLIQNSLQFVAQMFPRFGWDQVAVVGEGYPWADGLIGQLSENIPAFGIDVVDVNQYPAQIDDFQSVYDRAENAGADAMYVAMAHTGDDAIVDWATYRPSLGFCGSHVPMQIPAYYEMVNGACRYAITSSSATPQVDLTDKTAPFRNDFYEQVGMYPMHTGYTTYNSVLAYAMGVRRAGTTRSDDVVEALEEIEFESTTGTHSFQGPDDENPHGVPWYADDDEYIGSIYFQWQEDDDGNGIQEVIWPERIATGDYVEPPWF